MHVGLSYRLHKIRRSVVITPLASKVAKQRIILGSSVRVWRGEGERQTFVYSWVERYVMMPALGVVGFG